jgi:hypothetical protein
MNEDDGDDILEEIPIARLIAEGNMWYDKARAIYDSEEEFEQAQRELAPLIYKRMKARKAQEERDGLRCACGAYKNPQDPTCYFCKQNA